MCALSVEIYLRSQCSSVIDEIAKVSGRISFPISQLCCSSALLSCARSGHCVTRRGNADWRAKWKLHLPPLCVCVPVHLTIHGFFPLDHWALTPSEVWVKWVQLLEALLAKQTGQSIVHRESKWVFDRKEGKVNLGGIWINAPSTRKRGKEMFTSTTNRRQLFGRLLIIDLQQLFVKVMWCDVMLAKHRHCLMASSQASLPLRGKLQFW